MNCRMWKEYFKVNSGSYVKGTNIDIVRPASLHNPKDHAVMFITQNFVKYSDALLRCKNSLVFWPKEIEVPSEISGRHIIYFCINPHLQYCEFFRENHIIYLPKQEEVEEKGGAFIAKGAVIGKGTQIFPGAYIGGEVQIGEGVFIGSGVKLLGEVYIGNHVVIRENAVIGADGLSTDRDGNGKAVTMPQFGGVIIEDDVQIGALTVVARGAIDYTIIRSGAKIDNSCFLSHNIQIGMDTFVVGETIIFGSASIGERTFISGNSTIRNGIRIGNDSFIGMGSNVIHDISDCCIVRGNPAKPY